MGTKLNDKASLQTEPKAFLKSISNDALPHYIPIFSQVFDECRRYDQYLTC
jgi:hypothetical protein